MSSRSYSPSPTPRKSLPKLVEDHDDVENEIKVEANDKLEKEDGLEKAHLAMHTSGLTIPAHGITASGMASLFCQQPELAPFYVQAAYQFSLEEFVSWHSSILHIFLEDLQRESSGFLSTDDFFAPLLGFRSMPTNGEISAEIWRLSIKTKRSPAPLTGAAALEDERRQQDEQYRLQISGAGAGEDPAYKVQSDLMSAGSRATHYNEREWLVGRWRSTPKVPVSSIAGTRNSNPFTKESDFQFTTFKETRSPSGSMANTNALANFKAYLEIMLNPPSTIGMALATGSQWVLEQFLKRNCDNLHDSEYHWVCELNEIGCTWGEIAKILWDQRRDAPWVIFKPQTVAKIYFHEQHKHIPNCVHNILNPNEAVPSFEFARENPSHLEMLLQELCGVAGISPCSTDREQWNGSVDFCETGKAKVSYSLPSESDLLHSSQYYVRPRVYSALEKLAKAFGLVQSAGLCCDSFTMLSQTGNHIKNVVMTRIYFAEVQDLLSFRWNRWISGYGGIKRGGIGYGCKEVLSKLFDNLFGDQWREDLFHRKSWAMSEREGYCHLLTLAAQMLCLAFLSYSQAHVGPLRPFFLDTPLQQVTLLGAGLASAQKFGAVEARLVRLSCIGDMLQGPILTFRWIAHHEESQDVDQSLQFDLFASAEDIIDTWGPGKLIIERDGSQTLGIIIGGGLIHALSTDQDTQFHWSPSGVAPDPDQLKSFDPREPILVGTAVTINSECFRNEDEWWRKSCRSLRSLGTRSPSWSQDERQFGVQTGNFALVQANVTWRKLQPYTLKQYKLSQTDEHLVTFLEDPWAVQVSFCTGVSRRVALRDMIVDLLPVFAKAAVSKREYHIWHELETDYGVIDNFKRDVTSIRHWLHSIPDEHGKYTLQLIRQILDTLQDTGVDREGKHFTVAWPHESDLQKCFQIPCRKESSWFGFLADSEDCATFAYMTTKCLEMDRIRCAGSDACWGNAVPLLETAVLRLQTSLTTTAVVLQHKEVYYLKKLEGLFWVKAQRPVTSGGIVELVVWPSISPRSIQAKVTSLFRMRNDERLRELRERTALELAWAEEVAVRTVGQTDQP